MTQEVFRRQTQAARRAVLAAYRGAREGGKNPYTAMLLVSSHVSQNPGRWAMEGVNPSVAQVQTERYRTIIMKRILKHKQAGRTDSVWMGGEIK
jgi:hypothetical protein